MTSIILQYINTSIQSWNIPKIPAPCKEIIRCLSFFVDRVEPYILLDFELTLHVHAKYK